MLAQAGGIYSVHLGSAHAGTHYRFSFDSPLGVITRQDPWCREIAADGSCVVVDPSSFAWKSSSFVRPARNASIIYELHVGSFAADVAAGHGTFASTTTRLSAIADLGVNVVELMPVHLSSRDATSWGYGAQLWHAPKPAYGTSSDLRALVDEAHADGLAVWLDIVVNHADRSTSAPLYCFDGACDAASPGGVYFFGAGAYAMTPWGPRPDYPEPHVAEMLLDSVDQWITEYRGDGFRWDSVSNVRALDGSGTTPGGRDLLVAANARTHALGASSVAEDLKGYDMITQPSSKGGFDFDAQWDGFGYTIDGVLTASSDDARDLGAVSGALTGSYAGDPFARVLFTEDHDIVGNGGARLPSKIDPADAESFMARRLSMIGAVTVLTAPGVPMIFMGQEWLATGTFPSSPTPIAGATPVGAKVQVFYRDMIRLRRNVDGGAGGLLDVGVDVFHRNDTAKVIAYRRHGASGEDVIVVLNLRNKSYAEYDVGVDDATPWRVRINLDHVAYGDDFVEGQTGSITPKPMSKDGKPYGLPLQLGAYSAMVLTK
jgi:1,4-alpha-glucan branching enzyme